MGKREKWMEWYNKQARSLVIGLQPWTKLIVSPSWKRRKLCSWWRGGLRWRINYIVYCPIVKLVFCICFISLKKYIWFGAWFRKWSGVHSPLTTAYVTKSAWWLYFLIHNAPAIFPYSNTQTPIYKYTKHGYYGLFK